MFREDRKQIEQDINNFILKVDDLDNEIHLIDFEMVFNKILLIEDMISPLRKRIDINLKEEELLYSYKLGNFEHFDKILYKLELHTVIWKSAKKFFNLKKNVIYDFKISLNFPSLIEILNKLDKKIESNKDLATKESIEVIGKHSKLLKDDLIRLREFLIAIDGILNSENLDDILVQKVVLLLESRKLDTSLRQILSYVLRLKKIKIEIKK